MSVYTIRLNSGETLFGTIMKSDGSSISVENTLIMYERVDDSGDYSIMLARYMPFTSERVLVINRDNIIAFAPIHEELEEFYNLSLEHVKLLHDKEFSKNALKATDEMRDELLIVSAEGTDLSEVDPISPPFRRPSDTQENIISVAFAKPSSNTIN